MQLRVPFACGVAASPGLPFTPVFTRQQGGAGRLPFITWCGGAFAVAVRDFCRRWTGVEFGFVNSRNHHDRLVRKSP